MLQVPFTVLTFVDKSYTLSDNEQASISRIQSMARREYLTSFAPYDGIIPCNNTLKFSTQTFCFERYCPSNARLRGIDSVVYGTGR